MAHILITGAAGRIGRCLREGLQEPGVRLRLTDIADLGRPRDCEETVITDLASLDNALMVADGVDSIVHLASLVGADLAWKDVLRNNIETTYNVFEAARQKGVKRVVFASSIHFHGFLRRNVQATATTPYRPDSLYGVAKVFGEATGRLYADKYGLEVVCLRIASFRARPTSKRELGTWLSPSDAVRLVKASLSAAGVHFEVIYGVSKNSVGLYELGRAAELGYFPEDDSDAFAAEILNASGVKLEPEFEASFHGAHFVSPGFKGDLSKI
jgi:uronate dehydrogenase